MAKTRPSGKGEAWPERGEIYLATLDPTVGREIQKTRPVLVVQNDISNRFSDITIVAPITSSVRLPLSPLHVLIPAGLDTGLRVASVAVFNQVRAVDRVRLIHLLGQAPPALIPAIDAAIKAAFGLTDPAGEA